MHSNNTFPGVLASRKEKTGLTFSFGFEIKFILSNFFCLELAIIYHLEDGILTRYKGDYDYYLQQVELKKRQQVADYQKQQKEIADLEDFIARNKARVATSSNNNLVNKTLERCPPDKASTGLSKPISFNPNPPATSFILTSIV